MAEVLGFPERQPATSSPRGNLLLSRLAGDFQVPCPDALAPFHLASDVERTRRVRDVLRWAWRIYRRSDGRSMVDAVNDAADGAATGEYAKRTLRRLLLELNLQAWEAHPLRTRADVHSLFRRAINKLAHRPGGWQVRQ